MSGCPVKRFAQFAAFAFQFGNFYLTLFFLGGGFRVARTFGVQLGLQLDFPLADLALDYDFGGGRRLRRGDFRGGRGLIGGSPTSFRQSPTS